MGPLFIAAVCINEKDGEAFKESGIKDSKKLNKSKREKLQVFIKNNVVDYVVLAVKVKEINNSKNLNDLELENFAKSVKLLSVIPDIIRCDACDVNLERFTRRLKQELGEEYKNTLVESYHKGEDKCIAIASASIMAKCDRDKYMCEMAIRLSQDVGSGYPGDKKTLDYIKYFYKKKGEFPPETRKNWKTIKKMVV